MLTNLLKYLLGIFIFIGFIILISLSYFSIDIKKSNVNKVIETISYTGAFINKINYIDSIYTQSKDSFSVESKGNNININLKKGLFILSLGDLTKNYKINGENFLLDIKLPGDIFIDTQSDYITIFSINSSFALNFIDKKSKIINNLFLYPHEIYKFNPKFIGISIKKTSDIYRLKTINKLNFRPYIKSKIKNITKDNKLNFLVKEANILFDSYIRNKQLEIKNNNKILLKIDNLNIVDFPFGNFIEENKKYFVNKLKKSVYLQNRIYNNLLILFKSNKFDIIKINRVLDLLSELKQTDNKSYNDIENFINEIYKLIIYENNIKSYERLKIFLYLKHNRSNIEEVINFLNLKKIYFNYDFGTGINFKLNFNDFLDTYLRKSGITKKKEMYSLNDGVVLKQVESFVFYLKEYIKNHLFLDNLEQFKVETEILSKYLPLNKMIYFSGNVQRFKVRTSLKENRKLLERLEKFFRKNFFLKNRDKNNLLLLNKEKNIEGGAFELFKKQIEEIFSLYSNNKNDFSSNDKEDIKIYNNLYEKIDEEIKAHTKYDNYKLEYNEKLKEYNNIKGLGIKKDYNFTISDVKKYFNNFNHINYKDIEKKDNLFIIKDVYLNSKNYIFYFKPEGHIIDVYDLNNNFLFSFGSLDEIKELWDEKFKGAGEEEKYKYDFRNFFKLKFTSYNRKTSKTQEEVCAELGMIVDPNDNTKCTDKKGDSQIILLLKQKLIKEEFNILKEFFIIEYDNIIIKQLEGGKYGIELKDVLLNINIDINNNKKKYILKFSSNYDYYKHYFYNIHFNIEENKRKLFNGNNISFSKFKKIDTIKLKDEIKSFLNNIEQIKNIFNTLRSEYILNNLEIKYLNNSKQSFTYLNNNKKIIINLENNKIISIIVNNSNILKNIINIGDLKDYIDKLK